MTFTKLQKAFMQVIIETEINIANAEKKIEQHTTQMQGKIKKSDSIFSSKKTIQADVAELVKKVLVLKQAISDAKNEATLAQQHVDVLSQEDQLALRAEVTAEMARKSEDFAHFEGVLHEMNTPNPSPRSSPVKTLTVANPTTSAKPAVVKQASDSQVLAEKVPLLTRNSM